MKLHPKTGYPADFKFRRIDEDTREVTLYGRRLGRVARGWKGSGYQGSTGWQAVLMEFGCNADGDPRRTLREAAIDLFSFHNQEVRSPYPFTDFIEKFDRRRDA